MVDKEVQHRIFLIGDTGKPVLVDDMVLQLLKRKITEAGENSTVLFLGDNIYPNGLPTPGSPSRSLAEKRINVQLDILSGYLGKVYFISGNHDWNKGKKGGWAYIQRQEKYIEDYLQRGNVYLPDNGCPGPVEIDVNENFRVIFINTQWWLQKGERPEGEAGGCGIKSEMDFFERLEELLQKQGKHTLIAAHHPLYSKAMHGGNFNYKQHLFPLRAFHKILYIPLPLAGSLYPLYRKYFGAVEDISFPPYKKLKKQLIALFHHHPNLIYASGHDHNLQYIRRDNVHYLISGSGSQSAYVRTGRNSVFSYSKKGFIELKVLADKKIDIVAWGVNVLAPDGVKLYEGSMY